MGPAEAVCRRQGHGPVQAVSGLRHGAGPQPRGKPGTGQAVKRIYGMFLQGQSPFQIARTLTEEGIPSPGGKDHWNPSNIKSILTNEKYKGDALLQKSFTVDFLTKKKKAN